MHRPGLVHNLATVDVQNLTGDEPGLIGGQEHHGSHQIIGLLYALNGSSGDSRL